MGFDWWWPGSECCKVGGEGQPPQSWGVRVSPSASLQLSLSLSESAAAQLNCTREREEKRAREVKKGRVKSQNASFVLGALKRFCP